MLVRTAVLAAIAIAPSCLAIPAFVSHDPNAGVFGEPAGVTGRAPVVPREQETVDLWVKLGPSFSYDAVAVYYSLDNSPPAGANGVPGTPSTQVITSANAGDPIAFVRNEGGDDWWRVTMPAPSRDYGTVVRYLVSGYGPGGGELFAIDPSDGDNTFAYDVKLVWPGAGSGSPTPDQGYPPIWTWKEEAVVGNNYTNVMLDQNGSIYDMYYPSAGCVQGMGTKNEGYSEGPDTFPPLLPADNRGQMNFNQAFAGIRRNGTTYWLTNELGSDFDDNEQGYVENTNVVMTSQVLRADGASISVEQYDFSPKGIAYPLDDDGNPNRGMAVKRIILHNNSGLNTEELRVYFFADWALNGGDNFDGTFTDPTRGAMVSFDNANRLVSTTGEYNPTTFPDYEKDVSVYIAAAMKTVDSVGGASGSPAQDFWSDTSSDQGLGWVGVPVTLAPQETKELNILLVGGFDDFAGATGTYDVQMENAIDWFLSNSMADVQATTEQHWRDWLETGTLVDFPGNTYDEVHRRGLLATALHLDGENGGIIAGMHNGAYPFVWPRDAAWAAITLARTGFADEAEGIYEFLRDIAFRDVENGPGGWGRKGFWKQKYSTNGFTIWGTPQVDETSCYPWGLKYIYDVTGDIQLLEDHYDEVFEAGLASSQSSSIDNRMRYESAVDLMFSMNLWEDSFDVFIYSNASVVRGLRDAAMIADILDQNTCPGGPGTCGFHTDKALFESRADTIFNGTIARYNWNGENTDISLLGAAYPFNLLDASDPIMSLVIDRINGNATDAFGNNHPLTNGPGEWEGLINRYWNDQYWNNPGAPNPNGSPWFLSTMWYAIYHVLLQDFEPGSNAVDFALFTFDKILDRRGPIGFGAEQVAPNNSLLYPGQTDFQLQTAWPNAWESMSFFVDTNMSFLDYNPDAPGNTLRIDPKLPSAWDQMTFSNLKLGDHRIDVTVRDASENHAVEITNRTGSAFDLDVTTRVPSSTAICGVNRIVFDETGVLVSSAPAASFSYDPSTERLSILDAAAIGAGFVTRLEVASGNAPGDADGDGDTDTADITFVVSNLGSGAPGAVGTPGDVDGDGETDTADITFVVSNLGATCN
ncbi:MAG: glycoside hydrolase family 15 protein [Planctomycetota bacterium]